MLTLDRLPDARWRELGEFIAQATGLDFPPERRVDLQRGVTAAARELGSQDPAAFAERLLSATATEAQLQVLVDHLTIGETYFFRDKNTFDTLANRILPELVRLRRGRDQRLRFWSVGCCTGEEPYSLAMLLHQTVPDLSDWQVTLLATDINARFLRKAAAATYGQWSFRDAPAQLRERYFRRSREGLYVLRPEIRRLVTFRHLNLAGEGYPSAVTGTDAMDVILCRNVLMYFTPEQARKVVRNLRRALVAGGWLIVSPSEASHALFPDFAAVNFPGAVFYRKIDAKFEAG